MHPSSLRWRWDRFQLSVPTAVKKWGEDYTNHPVGTGAFKFVRWDRGDKVVLEVNEDYWGGRRQPRPHHIPIHSGQFRAAH